MSIFSNLAQNLKSNTSSGVAQQMSMGTQAKFPTYTPTKPTVSAGQMVSGIKNAVGGYINSALTVTKNNPNSLYNLTANKGNVTAPATTTQKQTTTSTKPTTTVANTSTKSNTSTTTVPTTAPAFNYQSQQSVPVATTTTTSQPTQTTQQQGDSTSNAILLSLIRNATMSPEELALKQELSKNKLGQATAIAGEQMSPETNAYQTGRIGLINMIANAQQQNIAQQAENLATSRGVAKDALTTALSAVTPKAVSPESTLVNPITGESTYGLGNTGGSGSNAYSNWVKTQTNAGMGADYQKQAVQLSTTLQQLDNVSTPLLKFMTDAGLNATGSPFANKSINTYLKEAGNPANATSLNAALADIKTYMAQILGSSGLNPTEVSDTVNSFDPANLSPTQLQTVLENLKLLGHARLQPLQQASSNAYNYGGTAFVGNNANAGGNFSIAENNPNGALNPVSTPLAQGMAGAGLNLLSSPGAVAGYLTGLAKTVLK